MSPEPMRPAPAHLSEADRQRWERANENAERWIRGCDDRRDPPPPDWPCLGDDEYGGAA